MMHNSLPHPDYEKYRGMRGLEFLRVSSAEQVKMYGWPRQHATSQAVIIGPLDIKVKFTIKDSYTGLDFQAHEALDEALDKAKKGLYDVFIVDTLDRLGRKGLEREIYILELRQAGVRVLSADPEDHSDDESSWGELIRYLKGKAAEDEVRNIRYRTMGGRRAKASGDPEKGIPPMHVCGGFRRYGYKWLSNEKGRKTGVELNHDVILKTEDGTEWTEVKVVKFLFESSASGMGLKEIGRTLNAMGMPSPYQTKHVKRRSGWNPMWQPSAIARMLHDKGFIGEATLFQTKVIGKKPGTNKEIRVKTDPSEQVIIQIPAIVSMELFEKVQDKLSKNKIQAARRNGTPEEFLLRAGIAYCGHCGSRMMAKHRMYKRKNGNEYDQLGYTCMGRYGVLDGVNNKCKGCWHDAHSLDDAAWASALEIVNNPQKVNEEVAKRRKKDPTAENRRKIQAKIKEIQGQQEMFRKQLRDLMLEGALDQGTRDFLTRELNQLSMQAQDWNTKLLENEDVHKRWQAVDDKLTEIHETCQCVRENMSDPEYIPTYQEKRDLLDFFHIRVLVYRTGEKQRFKITSNPVDIDNTLSCLAWPAM